MTDPFNLNRFLDAQAPIYPEVLTELRNQRKTAHWIWFIFPQIQGLGLSPISQRFAIHPSPRKPSLTSITQSSASV